MTDHERTDAALPADHAPARRYTDEQLEIIRRGEEARRWYHSVRGTEDDPIVRVRRTLERMRNRRY
jgi:hypothetical protein